MNAYPDSAKNLRYYIVVTTKYFKNAEIMFIKSDVALESVKEQYRQMIAKADEDMQESE